ncbi:RNA polymerase sigma factor [Desulfothermobacter acidiphilus]|uniref:RNA polymerase sigma factor n=1 Tax=Desulfothermobacter acidiphilus TaxID=1938353 RepID=UPI003F89B86A
MTVLEEYYAQFGAEVFNIALRIMRDPAAAEDVTQTAFLRACEELQKGAVLSQPRAWLLRVATNAALDELRRRKRLAPAAEFPLMSAPSPAPAEDLAQREVVAAVWEVLGRLKPRYRAALILRAAGLPGEAAARALGVSAAHERVLFGRAREALRRELMRAVAGAQAPPACRECLRLLAGEEAPPAVAAHLEGCPRCQAAAAAYRERYYGLGLLPLVALPAGLGTKVAEAAATGATAAGMKAALGKGLIARLAEWLGLHKAAAAATVAVIAAAAAGLWAVTEQREPHREWVISGGVEAVRQPGPVNGDFETGFLKPWKGATSYLPGFGRFGQTKPRRSTVEVAPTHAYHSRFGCRLLVEAASSPASAYIAQSFLDGSSGYALWLKVPKGTSRPEVLVSVMAEHGKKIYRLC